MIDVVWHPKCQGDEIRTLTFSKGSVLLRESPGVFSIQNGSGDVLAIVQNFDVIVITKEHESNV